MNLAQGDEQLIRCTIAYFSISDTRRKTNLTSLDSKKELESPAQYQGKYIDETMNFILRGLSEQNKPENESIPMSNHLSTGNIDKPRSDLRIGCNSRSNATMNPAVRHRSPSDNSGALNKGNKGCILRKNFC